MSEGSVLIVVGVVLLVLGFLERRSVVMLAGVVLVFIGAVMRGDV